MLNKIKLFLVAGLGIAAAIFYGMFQREKAGRLEDRAEAQEAKDEVEQLGVEAMVSGLEKQQEIRNEEIDTSRRDHFE